MPDSEPTYSITCLYGVKYIEPPQSHVHVERIGGIPFRYWAANDIMRMGPFTTRAEARSWCSALGRFDAR